MVQFRRSLGLTRNARSLALLGAIAVIGVVAFESSTSSSARATTAISAPGRGANVQSSLFGTLLSKKGRATAGPSRTGGSAGGGPAAPPLERFAEVKPTVRTAPDAPAGVAPLGGPFVFSPPFGPAPVPGAVGGPGGTIGGGGGSAPPLLSPGFGGGGVGGGGGGGGVAPAPEPGQPPVVTPEPPVVTPEPPVVTPPVVTPEPPVVPPVTPEPPVVTPPPPVTPPVTPEPPVTPPRASGHASRDSAGRYAACDAAGRDATGAADKPWRSRRAGAVNLVADDRGLRCPGPSIAAAWPR